ncbi:MAG: type II toxin-antitoxin system RelE/ParE family toxin [Pseudomonadota bacterium]
MKVVFTRGAEAALEQIGDYIAQDNPSRALSFVHELREKSLGLADMPEAFPLVPRYARLGIRRRVHGDYLILYQVAAREITILLVAHGARDYDRLLDEEG